MSSRLNLASQTAPESMTFSPATFGSDVKSFKMGQRLKAKVESAPGPGAYQADKADSFTKVKSPIVRLDSGPARPDHFAKKSANLAEPLSYQPLP